MVGEIRDSETAGLAINASLTGQLILSTLHTTDAATALPRLLDMGIEPYLIASTVKMIIGQRLVRKASSSGYSGRININEVLVIDDDIREAILKKSSANEIKRIAETNGMITMLKDGLKKAGSGLTTKEEVQRIFHA